jgi:hypothetical protein
VIRFARLTPAVVEQDHAAVMRDVPLLRAWSGQDWPTPSFTVAENLVDLVRHDREHADRIAFTHSVLLDDVIVGCVYVHRFERGLRTRDITSAVDPSRQLDAVVRGWCHDVTADVLVEACRTAFPDPFDAGGRWWWQTNTGCPEQLAACDRLGLTDELAFVTPAATWVLRAVPE